MPQKKNFPIILAVLIPIAMVALVAASIYLPRLYVHPQYGFLYYADYCDTYSVSGSMLKSNPVAQSDSYCYRSANPKLYIYDARTGNSKEAAFADARRLVLDQAKISPDGFTVTNPESGGNYYPFYFGSDDYDSEYLKGNGTTFRVELPEGVSDYSFKFLGWIKE
jgi:hypothetical protein